MSNLWERNIKGNRVLFVNSSRNTRYGFAHDSELFINGWNYGSNTAYYLNRTWERFTYQTVMRGCVIKARDSRTDYLLRDFKERNNYGRLTAKRKLEFEKEISNDAELELYTDILKELE